MRRGGPLRRRRRPGGPEWGLPLDIAAVLAAHPAPNLVAAVHAETSTGVANDIARLAAAVHRGDALLLADCVTSLAGIDVAIDDWGVDLAYAGTQKCLGVAPGLAPFTITPGPWHGGSSSRQTWYLDLGMLADYAARPRRPQVPPHRPCGHDHVAARRPRRAPRRGPRRSRAATPSAAGCCTTAS